MTHTPENQIPFSDYITNEDQKLNLTLPYSVWEVIYNDIQDFSPDITSATKLASFLNTIILNCSNAPYLLPYPVNIPNQIAELRSEYAKSLPSEISYFRDDLLHNLDNTYESSLKSASISSIKSKGLARKFRLNNKVFKEICKIDVSDSRVRIFEKPSIYLKILFIEYSKLPSSEREKIYFYPLVKIIEEAISSGKNLSITTCNQRFDAVPYKLISDTALSHLYLIGVSSCFPATDDSTYKDASFRISRIQDISLSGIKKVLTKTDKRRLEDNIRFNHLQFLIGKKYNIKIKFTKEGLSKYQTQSYLKPTFLSKKDNVYEFCISREQLDAYFFKFGKDAEILEPEELRNYFIQKYKDALQAYHINTFKTEN